MTRSDAHDPAGIAQMVRAAQAGGFNTLIVQVRGRGDAYYHSTLEPRAAELAGSPTSIRSPKPSRLAREAGLQVHAWVAVNLVSSATELPRRASTSSTGIPSG